MESNILYREANLFSHSYVWIATICLTFSSVYFALPEIFTIGGDKPPSSLVVTLSIIFLAVGFILPILLLILKMRIQVRGDGLYVKIIPFHLSFRKFTFDGLQNCEPYLPHPNEENKLGLVQAISKKCYSLGGKKGIRLEYRDGRTILLESRRPEKIIEAIKTAGKMTR